MRLPEICIKHPVFATVLSLMLMVIGVVSYQCLDLRFFPDLSQPIVYVAIHYQGANAETMESSVTNIVENSLAGIRGITSIYSGSRTSYSYLTVMFSPGGDFQEEANEVRNKIYGIRDKLPADIDPPVVTVGGSSDTLMHIGFRDKIWSTAQIRDYVNSNIEPILKQIDGVGSAGITGASDYAMRIWLDSAKMTALGVTVTDIKNALEANNIEFPAGYVRNPTRNYSIVSRTRLKTVADFANIIIRHDAGRTIRFKDVAKIELGSRSLEDAPMRINGEPGIDIDLRPLRGANPIAVAKRVKKALHAIRADLPKHLKMHINYDKSIFLKASINETFKAIGAAIILVVLVVFLFLGSLRASLIPIVTIPVCMVAVFAVMLLFGFTINTLSLFALILAIGLVVDDAIVVLENIHRHIENGMSAYQAALTGSKEIALPVIAMTLTLAAVYAPIGFAQGFTAEIFKEFAFTLAGAVIISGFVALTLSPMMCDKLLLPPNRESKFAHKLEHIFNYSAHKYRLILQKILLHRIIVVIVLLLIALSGWFIYNSIHAEFIPKEDTGQIIGTITAPTGSNLDYTNRYTKQIENIFAKIPEAQSYYAMVHSGSAQAFITLHPWHNRKRSADEIVAALTPKLANITGVDATVTTPDPVQYGIGGHDISFNIMTTGTYDSLRKPTDKFVAALRKYAGLQNVNTNLKYDAQQYALTINRNLAAVLDVNLQDIATTVSAMLGGSHITDVEAGNRSYAVVVQMQKSDLKNFRGFTKLYVRNANGAMIPLSSLVTLTPIIGQPTRSHYNRMRNSVINGDLTPGYTESEAINYILKLVPQILTPNLHFAFDGKAKDFLDSKGGMSNIFLLALIFIYLVLSAQFGSFIDPFIILLAVPLCIVGALLTLKLVGGTLNVYTQIGLITLVGMISKHGILITQFANTLRAKGMALNEALLEAASIRLRPILMTTFAMIFGSIPLALSTGPGSVGREQIGWVIVGGLFFGTFFSLIVVPIAYSFFAKWRKLT